MNENIEKESNKLFKQRLQRVHVVTGISFSLLMYVAVFFGIFAILLPYIQVWEKPSRHFKLADITTINYNSMIEPVLTDSKYPKINPISITFPGYMQDPSLRISTDYMETKIFLIEDLYKKNNYLQVAYNPIVVPVNPPAVVVER